MCAPFPAAAAADGRRALFVLRGILDGELRKTGMPYPSVPEALGSGVGSLLADEALVADLTQFEAGDKSAQGAEDMEDPLLELLRRGTSLQQDDFLGELQHQRNPQDVATA